VLKRISLILISLSCITSAIASPQDNNGVQSIYAAQYLDGKPAYYGSGLGTSLQDASGNSVATNVFIHQTYYVFSAFLKYPDLKLPDGDYTLVNLSPGRLNGQKYKYCVYSVAFNIQNGQPDNIHVVAPKPGPSVIPCNLNNFTIKHSYDGDSSLALSIDYSDQ
jgi:hypothetical protein